MVSRAVLFETGLSGKELDRNIAQVADSELAKGKAIEVVTAEMGSALAAFNEAKRAGKLTQFVPKAENFIGGGMWRDPKMWPWKDGHGPPGESKPRLAIDKL
jgi:hypothetical protein